MRMKKLTSAALIALALSVTVALSVLMVGCNDPKPEPAPEASAKAITAVVWGYEWGPAIPKIVVEFSDAVKDVDKDAFAVKTGTANRTVKDAYPSDAKGNKTTESSKYVAIEMSTKYGEGSPFSYNQTSSKNEWAQSVTFTVTANKDLSVGNAKWEKGKKFTYKCGENDRIVPQTESWNKDTYRYTENGKDITLQRASWSPEGAKTDGGKNPLIIWLHGMGEGGTDIDIALLGNEVTALTTENETNIQKYFTTSTCKGAYVLALQTPTMWMDDGDGKNNVDKPGTDKQPSMYTDALYKAITTYVDGNSDIDTNRIYLGGCSNGGYMTMNMAFEHGDYFTAFYPVCEAYNNSKITDDMIAQIKDYKMWFLQSDDDKTVDPDKFVKSTYLRLLQAGAQNMHFTYTGVVKGTDDPNPWSWMGSGKYDGHWVWVYAFNDQVKTQFDNSTITSKEDMTSANCTKEGNMWQWLSEQTKAA